MAIQRVFISHAKQDNQWCRLFASTLQSAGFTVWFDEGGPALGASWVAAQEQAVSQCDIVILILTPDALASPWVQHEHAIASSAHRSIGPVIIEATILPDNLQALQPMYCIDQHPVPVAQMLAEKFTTPPQVNYPIEQRSDYPASSLEPSNVRSIHQHHSSQASTISPIERGQ